MTDHPRKDRREFAEALLDGTSGDGAYGGPDDSSSAEEIAKAKYAIVQEDSDRRSIVFHCDNDEELARALVTEGRDTDYEGVEWYSAIYVVATGEHWQRDAEIVYTVTLNGKQYRFDEKFEPID